MIRPVAESEIDFVCEQICSISPFTVLGILGNELAHGIRVDPLRRLFVWLPEEGAKIGGAIVIREKAAAELLFFRGFGPALAQRHHVNYPCEWTDIPSGGYVGSLAVFDGQTGRGIGQQLIDAAHEKFRAAGHRHSYLMVSDFNRNARRFYERNGYQAIAHMDDCIRPGNREHLMEMLL